MTTPTQDRELLEQALKFVETQIRKDVLACKGIPPQETADLHAALSARLAQPDAVGVAEDFDEWWRSEVEANGGVGIGADYRHWAEKGYRAASKSVGVAGGEVSETAPVYANDAELIAALREHNDPRLYLEADELMATAANRIEAAPKSGDMTQGEPYGKLTCYACTEKELAQPSVSTNQDKQIAEFARRLVEAQQSLGITITADELWAMYACRHPAYSTGAVKISDEQETMLATMVGVTVGTLADVGFTAEQIAYGFRQNVLLRAYEVVTKPHKYGAAAQPKGKDHG